MVYIPDDSDFSSFRDQCESLEGWHCRYNKAGVTVWSQGQEESCTVQKIKVSRRFPAPAVCPAAPEGPWGPARAGGARPSLPGGVSAPNSRPGRVRPPKVLPCCPAGSCCPPRGFSCRDPCSLLPCGLTWRLSPVPTRAGRPRDQLRYGDGLAGSPRTRDGLTGRLPGVLSLGHSPSHPGGVGSRRSPRRCLGRFVARQGLGLGCCRGARRLSHPSGTLLITYTAPVTLPGDPGHIRGGCRVLGAQGEPTVGVTGFGFSGHQESRLLGRDGIRQSKERQNIRPPGQPSRWRVFNRGC